MRDIEELQNFSIRILPAVIFENLHMHTPGVSAAKPRSDLHRAMRGIVAPDESAHESDHNRRRLSRLRAGFRSFASIRTEILMDSFRVLSGRRPGYCQHCRSRIRCRWPWCSE